MRIIVCGAGQVGASIAKHLAAEDNYVTVIDHSEALVRKISDTLDVKAIAGYASYPAVLEEAGAHEADMLIAVTNLDEINMVACQVAHSLFNVPTKIARIRSQHYLKPVWKDLYRHDHLPIDVIISPELEVAKAINHRLHVPGARDTLPFADGKIKVVAIRCTLECPLVMMRIERITKNFANLSVAILGIMRAGHFLIPSEKEQLLAGDEVYLVMDSQHVQRVMELFGYEEREARRVIIIGGGNIGLFLAQQLEEENEYIRLKVIEIDKERAEFAAERLTDATVINGNALSQEILHEVNIQDTETVIAITNDDEVNILSSLLAKQLGCKRAVTLINNSASYASLISSLGIDVAVQPKEITVSSILQHIRRGRIRSVHTICDGLAEIVEAEASEASPMIGKAIRDMELPHGIVIGAILRNDKVLIPDPDTVIRVGDHIIILSLAGMVKKVERIFSVKFEYF